MARTAQDIRAELAALPDPGPRPITDMLLAGTLPQHCYLDAAALNRARAAAKRERTAPAGT